MLQESKFQSPSEINLIFIDPVFEGTLFYRKIEKIKLFIFFEKDVEYVKLALLILINWG